jgi:Fe(3+) dicitrate transport protein
MNNTVRCCTPTIRKTRLSLAIAATLQFPLYALAGEVVLPRIDVVGNDAQAVKKIPGAVSIVSKEELQLLQPMSTEAALKNVPGIAIKPEEESAVVANIGMRGLSAADYKTLILEDGVPVAPGLFVGNGRYYNPRIQRMESIEVLKGAASLRYGPSTIGGVINYQTKTPEPGVLLSSRVGSFGYREAMLEAGGRSDSGETIGGIVYSKASSDGFQNKGFDMEDLMLKGGMAIGNSQWIGLKLTHYKNDANISYRGHFLDAYKSGTKDNPAPDDWFLTERQSVDLNHEWQINPDATLNTLFYWSTVYRDYWRYGTVGGTPTVGTGADKRWNYSNSVQGNNRSFDRMGVDSRLNIRHNSFGMANEAEFGVRLMEEEMVDQTINATRANPRSGNMTKDVIDSATSLALFAQNRFIVSDKLGITPGLRIERYTQKRHERMDVGATPGQDAKTSNVEYLPGIGATYQATPAAQIFGGVYKAFSPALNGDALDGLADQQLDAERSVNLELGLRGGNERVNYEIAAFRMEFDNQIVPANSNTNFQKTNGGKTLHQGLEAAMGYGFANGFSINANATYIPIAKFVGNRYNANGTLNTPGDNRVTYTPEWVSNLSLGYKSGPLQATLSINHVGSQFTDTANTTALAESTTGFFTGKLDAYTTADLTASYAFDKKLSVFGAIKNLTDKQYIASLRQGVYAGPDRSIEIGAKYRF